MKKTKSGVGVVVGRFQVPSLHEGHTKLLDTASKHKRLAVLIGIHPFLVTPTDPLDYPTRERMIKEIYPYAITMAVPDQPSDTIWSRNLDKLIRTYFPLDEIKLYCGRDGFKSHYSGNFEVVEIDEVSPVSGTSIRDTVSQEVQGSYDFRAGVIYGAYNKYPVVSPTVDIATYRYADRLGENERIQVLLGQKPNQPGKWRFPGGFIDMKDETGEASAVRELHEETGILVEKQNLEYVGSYKVKDWRSGPKNQIFTTLFAVEHSYGPIQAGDDLGTVDWIDIEKLELTNIVDNHRKLAKDFYDFIKRKENNKNNLKEKKKFLKPERFA